jgi:4-amino-4-deoxy-L-arabinose transferase-like glycosyltransferase
MHIFNFDKNRRLHHIVLLVVIFLALAVRLAMVISWNANNPDAVPGLVGDEPSYDNTARELLAGYGFNWPGRVPLYPLWLAGIYLLTDGSIEALRHIQAVFSLTTVLLVYWLGWREFGAVAGLLAALGTALSYPMIHHPVRVWSEVLYTPVVLLVTLVLFRAVNQPTSRGLIWLGILIGLSNLVRPALLMFPVFLLLLFIPIWGLSQGFRRGAVVLASSLLVVTPWIIHNTLKYRALFPLQTSNAILWQGSPEYYHLTHEQGYTYMRIWTEILYGPGWETNDPNSIAGDRYWTQRAIESIRREPGIYLLFAFEKIFTYWIGDPSADWFDSFPFDYYRLTDWAGFSDKMAIQIMIARFVPILAVFALILLRKQWPSLLPILVVLAYFNLLHAATHAEVRLSEPLLPLLFILISVALTKQSKRVIPQNV